MKLVWLRYNKKNKAQHALFLMLGERGNKLIMLRSDKVDDGELSELRRHIPRLSSLSLDGRIRWLRDNCPRTVRNAFRITAKNKVHILDQYEPT